MDDLQSELSMFLLSVSTFTRDLRRRKNKIASIKYKVQNHALHCSKHQITMYPKRMSNEQVCVSLSSIITWKQQ